MMNKVVVCISDVHGCLEELDELLHMISYSPEQMRLVFLGDLLDRGPDPIGCVRKAMELKADCILGNHEEKFNRWQRHEANFRNTGKTNPMQTVTESRKILWNRFSQEEIDWLRVRPLKLDLGNNLWAIHGGLEPRFSFENQKESQIIRARWIDAEGKAVPLNPDKSQPEGTKYWAGLWKGPESVIYAHCTHKNNEHRYDYFDKGFCLGIDTGCVFGGKLTAAFIYTDMKYELYSVAAKKIYSVKMGQE